MGCRGENGEETRGHGAMSDVDEREVHRLHKLDSVPSFHSHESVCCVRLSLFIFFLC